VLGGNLYVFDLTSDSAALEQVRAMGSR
jgi:hypothetical protein